jgi:hypothetical protein
MSRWTSRDLDGADVGELREIPVAAILAHADGVAEQRLRPRDLFRRWERQRWDADEIPLEGDVETWFERFPASLQDNLRRLLCAFVIGEYTALDLLGPIMLGAPEEEDLLYLGSQVADEALHTRFMQRIAADLLGLGGGAGETLAAAWPATSQSHRELCALEGALLRDLAEAPQDYGAWLRAVTVFHLVTEGVLALVGQRRLVSGLRRAGILGGVSAGFVAMTRDESRHVSYGLHALRLGVRAGYEGQIGAVVERAAPLVATIEVRPGDRPRDRWLARQTGQKAIAALTARMGQAGLQPGLIEHVVLLSTAALGAAGEREEAEHA